MDVMEVIDAGRVFPRMFLALTGYLIWDVVQWFQALGTPNTQQASLLVTIVGIIPAVLGFYMNSGKNWDRSEDVHRNDSA